MSSKFAISFLKTYVSLDVAKTQNGKRNRKWNRMKKNNLKVLSTASSIN